MLARLGVVCFVLAVLTGFSGAAADEKIPGLDTSGEVSLRYERDLNAPVKADRVRYRARLGWIYTNPSKEWTYVFHMRTANPFFQNSTWTTIDQHQVEGFWPDEAYVEWRPASRPGWAVDVGEFPMPFHNNPVYSSTIWSVVMMEGGANVSYTDKAHDWWVSGGPWFALPQDVGGHLGDFSAFGLQAGKRWNAPHGGQRLQFSVAMTDYGWDQNGLNALLGRNQGNAVVKAAGKAVMFASGFNIVDPRLDYFFTSGKTPMAATIDYWANTAGSVTGVPINRKDGWAIGITGGRVEYPGKFSVQLEYLNVGQDSVFSPMAQGDFVQLTNFDGFYANVTVPLTRRLSAALVEERTDQSSVNTVENRTSVDVYYRY